ncbi:MAG: hypothetical protein AAGU21_10215 [Solidesulfovibrio sp.]|uniref:hypothetical protein n=1 Tax=Solidesulfovibrio sp. TaxID=2910990 RepID=UPI0031591AD9
MSTQSNIASDEQSSSPIAFLSTKQKYIDQHGEKYIEIKKFHKYVIVKACDTDTLKYLNYEYKKLSNKVIQWNDYQEIIDCLFFDCANLKTVYSFTRLGFVKSTLYYALQNPAKDIIEIDARGWRLSESARAISVLDSRQLPVNMPPEHGNLKKILKYFRLKNKEDEMLLLASICAMIRVDIERPILGLIGEPGSAKSSCAKMIRKLVEPRNPICCDTTMDDHNLAIVFKNNDIPLFDNLPSIKKNVSDMFCKSITGGGFEKRMMYKDGDTYSFSFRNGIIFTSIDMPSDRPDFIDRSVIIELERIPETALKSQKQLQESFDCDLPEILSGLFDTVSGALRIEQDIELKKSVRLHEFAIFGSAVCHVLGYDANSFMLNLIKRTKDLKSDLNLTKDNILCAIVELVRKHDSIECLTSELLERIKPSLGKAAFQINAHALGHVINKHSDTFRTLGISCSKFKSRNGTSIKLEKTEVFQDKSYNYDEQIVVIRNDIAEGYSAKIDPNDDYVGKDINDDICNADDDQYKDLF